MLCLCAFTQQTHNQFPIHSPAVFPSISQFINSHSGIVTCDAAGESIAVTRPRVHSNS